MADSTSPRSTPPSSARAPRECTSGVEWTNPPEHVRAALNTHPRFKAFDNVPGPDLAVSVRIITRQAARRIVTAAFEYAQEAWLQGRDHLRKAQRGPRNLGHDGRDRQGSGQEYPGIALWSTNIDAQLMWLNKNPEDYNVIVASNLFGDILSDAFAGLVGGLGFAASGNIGDEVAVFEPTHGSAPKYAELNPPIVNPIAMILSAAMMLDHVGEGAKADRIRNAIAEVVQEGKVRTYDMMRIPGGREIDRPGRGQHGPDDRRDPGEAEVRTAWRTAALGCPAERARQIGSRKNLVELLDRTAEGGCPHVGCGEMTNSAEKRRAWAKPGTAAATSAPTCTWPLNRATAAGSRSPCSPGSRLTMATPSRRRRGRCSTCWASSMPASKSATRARCRSSFPRGSRPRRGAPGWAWDARLCRKRVALPEPSPRDRLRRSRLYLPGSEPKYFINAALHGPDAIILDLEDSVHHAEKDAARILVRNTLRAVDFGRCERMVRINQLPMGLEDLAEIVPESPDLVLLPKAELPEQIAETDRMIGELKGRYGITRPIWLMPILESALGIENASAIAQASKNVVALTIGLEDYTADLGVAKTPEGRESLYARSRLVNAAKALGVQAIDSVFGDVGDMDGLRRWAENSRALGFEGMGCIHPGQIPVIHEAFAPSPAEVEKASKIVAAFDEAQQRGLGVVSLGSKMIDPPVVQRAQRLVELAKRIGKTP